MDCVVGWTSLLQIVPPFCRRCTAAAVGDTGGRGLAGVYPQVNITDGVASSGVVGSEGKVHGRAIATGSPSIKKSLRLSDVATLLLLQGQMTLSAVCSHT